MTTPNLFCMNQKVLAILTSRVLYGKERANITVYKILKEKCNKEIHVVHNSAAEIKLKSALAEFYMHSIVAPSRQQRPCRICRYILEYINSNIKLLILIHRLNPEVIMMCNEINFYDFYPALLLSRKKILYRVGDTPAYESLSFRIYNEYVWKNFVIKKVNRMVSNAKFVQDSLIATGRVPTNDCIIYNYPPQRNFVNVNEEAKYKVIDSTSIISYGFIGQVNEPKGVRHLIESTLAILSKGYKISLLIAGSLDYDKEFSQEISSIIPEKYKSLIIFLGEIENLDLFFNYIDVLCIPSIKQEPLANVLSEAKYHSCPSIIYPSGGLPELVTHGVDGYICSSPTSNDLYESMKFYILNKHLIPTQGQAAFSSIPKYGIDRETFEDKWIKAYTTIH